MHDIHETKWKMFSYTKNISCKQSDYQTSNLVKSFNDKRIIDNQQPHHQLIHRTQRHRRASFSVAGSVSRKRGPATQRSMPSSTQSVHSVTRGVPVHTAGVQRKSICRKNPTSIKVAGSQQTNTATR